MSSIFYELKFNKDISKWDVSNVIDMSDMFNDSNFNQDISNWNISNVTNMSFMFYDSKFNRSINKWFNKINDKCKLNNFIKNENVEISSYNDFKKYHREIILKKL